MINDYKILTCDSCGLDRIVKETEANRARLQATREGWKSFSYTNLKLTSSRVVSRLWDACPTCEFPDHATVLARVQQEEDQGTRKKSHRS